MTEHNETSNENEEWEVWEVFAQTKWGRQHEHCGSVHAPDSEMALQNARDVYARRDSVKSLWVVPASAIHATTLGDQGPFFDAADDKPYRHPQFYKVPRGVRNL